MKQTYWVSIYKGRSEETESRVFSPEQQKRAQFQEWLSDARDVKGSGGCRCRFGSELPLSIVRRGENCHLAKYRYTGAHHKEDCRFYSRLAGEGGQEAYHQEALRETPAGTLMISLDVPLKKLGDGEAEPAETPAPRPAGKTVKRNKMTLLGLLHLLWETSRYTEWHPAWEGSRNGPLMGWHLRKSAENIRAAGCRLADLMLTPSGSKGDRDAKRNADAVSRAHKSETRLIAVAELAAWQPGFTTCPNRLPIRDFHGMPFLTIAPSLWRALGHSFSRELDAWKGGARTIVIAYVDPEAPREKLVRQAALMTVSPRFIPVDSGHEMKLEGILHASGRKFMKPLRYDAGLADYLPDFYLTDLAATEDNLFALEVWGMDSVAYRLHRQEKTTWYNTAYTPAGWWSWDAFRFPDTVPPLPAADALLGRQHHTGMD
ncbi:DUF1173 family protein [Pantoea agglomerans]|uniref:DUF1173 domain-containing protein n=1 Tax=Enterobacter agglomerans TaxID=549 RepID=A0AAN2K8H6_ENTAG|nr:DUF1173 family protein [Pantoea agglomerans]CAH6376178.1 DUF1173 domain-containing protein [Pantoea agglomerans]